MKRIFVLLTLIALALIGSLAQAADKVIVIPLMRSSISAAPVGGGLNFDITDDGVTFTSLSKGWTFAGVTPVGLGLSVEFTFITNKGFIFSVGSAVSSTFPVFESDDCSGVGYVTPIPQRFQVFENSGSLFYLKSTDTPIDITSQSSYIDMCYPLTPELISVLPVYPNDPAVTGVDFVDPTNIKIVPHVES